MYYNMIRTPAGYRMAKFDEFMNVEAVYNITYRRGRFYCDCPQGMKAPTCRHRDMVSVFCTHKAVNTGKLYCLDENTWHPAIEG